MSAAPTRRMVSLIVAHADGSLSSTAFAATAELLADLAVQLGEVTGGPLYNRHIPADDVATAAAKVGRLGIILARD